MKHDIEVVVKSYIECAIWADAPEGAYVWGPSRDFVRAARRDCKDFLDLLGNEKVDSSEWDDTQFGYDFWLTRQRHGAGFWDRGRAAGDALSKWAKTFGSVDTYVTRRGRFAIG